MRVAKEVRKKNKIYYKNEYDKLLKFCWLTTNLGEKTESFLNFIAKQNWITEKQYQALHQIAVSCTEAHSAQKILHNIHFEEPTKID